MNYLLSVLPPSCVYSRHSIFFFFFFNATLILDHFFLQSEDCSTPSTERAHLVRHFFS